MVSKPQDTGVATFQTDVGPGDVTGVYYITICNLPFETSWQQLKDWLRPHCEVDHIEVFNTSTSGWVRLRGRDNFDNAWKRLNGGVFRGRSIIASDKNKSEAIKIKELVDIELKALREQVRAASAPMTQPASPTLYGSPVSVTMTPQTSEGGGMQYYAATISPACFPMGPAPVADYAVMPHYLTPIGGWTFSHGPPGMKTTYQCQHRPSNPINYTDQRQKVLKHQVYTTLPRGESSRSGPVHDTSLDHYKILLKNIPHRSGAKDIDIWARRRLGAQERGLNGVDVPIDNSGVYSRGHAVLRFNCLVQPATVVKKLHQHTFRGRTISASILEDEAAPAKGLWKSGAAGPRGGGESGAGPSTLSPWAILSGQGPLVVEGSAGKGTGPGH